MLQMRSFEKLQCQHIYRFFNRPIRELGCIAQMTQVVNVAEQFAFQLWITDNRYGTILIQRSCIAVQSRGEICQMWCYFFYHHPPWTKRKIFLDYFFFWGGGGGGLGVGGWGLVGWLVSRHNVNWLIVFRYLVPIQYLISLLQMASGVSNSPRKICANLSGS